MSKPLKLILETLIPRHHLWKFELFKRWETIIGPNLKNKVFIEKIDNNTLFLSVTHPAWAQELSFMTSLLKQQINAGFTEPKITTIRIRSHTVSTPRPQSNSSQQHTPVPEAPQQPLTVQELSLLASVPSRELQSAIASYLTRCKNLKRSNNETR